MQHRTLIIAEAGVNHNGSLDLARELVKHAAEAGADFVKFQTFKAEKLVQRAAKKAAYQEAQTGGGESQFDMIRKLELDTDAHEALIAECEACGINFLSTAFDLGSIDLLEQFQLPLYKIPSGEITNRPYLAKIGSLGKPVILSTGMATLGEIEAAIQVLESAGMGRDQLTVLHCNTEYPTPMEDVNLRAMQSIGAAFGVEVGYSDHTLGIEVPIAAVAMGATVIEKHFTLDKNLEGPDHRASLEPAELAQMVTGIRNVERALGDGIKRPSPSERKNIAVARKSIFVDQKLPAGTQLKPGHLVVKRPMSGLSPMHWDDVLGKTLRHEVPDNHALAWTDLEESS